GKRDIVETGTTNMLLLITQRLPFCQHKLDTLESFALGKQRQKRLTLEIEEILLANQRGFRQIAARHDVSQFIGNLSIVFRDKFPGLHAIGTNQEHSECRLT